MTKLEAERIAAVINLIRPEWSTPLLMTVLGDDRMRARTYSDAMVVMVAMAVDMTSKRPGRVHESGRWWMTVTATAPPASYKVPDPMDCSTCGQPEFAHPLSKTDPHKWEPQHARSESTPPTRDQRAAIDKAIADAKHAQAAAKEAASPKREPRDPNDIIASHLDTTAKLAAQPPRTPHDPEQTNEDLGETT